MSLVTLDNMKNYLSIPLGDLTQDAFLTSQINLMSETIENYCGRKFLTASYVQTFEAQDFEANEIQKLYLFHYPIVTITEIKEVQQLEDGSTDETIITSQEYNKHDPSARVTRTTLSNGRMSWFTSYGAASQVVITYDAGTTEAPLPIQDVVFSLVEERYNKKISGVSFDFGSDVQRVSIPGVMSIDFDYTLQSNERKSSFGMIIGNYANVLDPYRSEGRVVGRIKDNYVV